MPRLIPVHTGNTGRRPCSIARFPAHPRAYGEYLFEQSKDAQGNGSSPCIRGIQVGRDQARNGRRLIPVHTGNTVVKLEPSLVSSAHPRAYGEYLDKLARAVMDSGSSPCIRGILNAAYR